MSFPLSSEVDHLDNVHKSRYIDKLNIAGLRVDPYLLPEENFTDLTKAPFLPRFAYHDLYQYVVNGVSPYTGEDLKAYKSLDAYQFFVAGWVREARWHCSGDSHLIMAQVHHSQALTAKLLKPWVVVKKDGVVVCAHCTCKAGLGEVCSHITALLYALRTAVKQLDKSCTDGPRQWGLAPVKAGKDLFEEGSGIDFSNPAKRCSGLKQRRHPNSNKQVGILTQAAAKFYQDLDNATPDTTRKSGLLRILPHYSQQFQPKVVSLGLPAPLNEMYNAEFRRLSGPELAEQCNATFKEITITPQQAIDIEAETRNQGQSRLWHSMRAGRVTASRFRSAARTDHSNPSRSLIRQICYPDLCRFSTAATRWGCRHESTARKTYVSIASAQHHGFTVRDSGFHIHLSHPYIGASPDALVCCFCCGSGVLEIKCPYCAKDTGVRRAAENKYFCLVNTENGLSLDTDHPYYYQVQAQLFVTGRKYCDFMVWSESDLFLQRILPDSDFIKEAMLKVEAFFKLGILPELLAKKYSSPEGTVNNGTEE